MPTQIPCLLVLFGLATVALSRPKEYSGWFNTNNSLVQYRWYAASYGKDITSDCVMQYRYTGSADTIEARVEIAYVPHVANSVPKPPRKTSLYLRPIGLVDDTTGNCNYITGITLSEVKERHSAGGNKEPQYFLVTCMDSSHVLARPWTRVHTDREAARKEEAERRKHNDTCTVDKISAAKAADIKKEQEK